MKASQKFLIIDQNLKSYHGHYYEYSYSVAEAAQSLGFEARIYAHRAWKVQSPQDPLISPCFGFSVGNTFQSALALLRDPKEAFRPWRSQFFLNLPLFRILKQEHLEAGDHVLIHSLDSFEQFFYLVQGFIHSGSRLQSPIHFVLRRHPEEFIFGKKERVFLQKAISLLNRKTKGSFPPFYFYSDTEQLVEEYQKRGIQKVSVLPIPMRTRILDEALQLKNLEREKEGKLKVVYLGDARMEKGYAHLPSLVRFFSSLREQHRTKPIQFLIQSCLYLPGKNLEPSMEVIRKELEAFPKDLVLLIQDLLNPLAYYQLLAQADVVVIPYDSVAYRFRSSGVFTEALLAGKPVIVPKGTWMESQLPKGAGLAYGSERELCEAVAKVLTDLEAFSQETLQKRFAWREEHHPLRLVRGLSENPLKMAY